MLQCYSDSFWALTWYLLHSRGLTYSLFSCDVGQLTHWEDEQKWNTCYGFSANCLTCQYGVRGSTDVAGDMDQVVSVPMGIHPEPIVALWFLPIAGCGRYWGGCCSSRVGRSEQHYSTASWALEKLTAEELESGYWQTLNQRPCEPGETSLF